jgi:nucleotide-binding universal stress UspA family protein
MKILCAIGMRFGAETIRRLAAVAGTSHELYLLHVIDSGPRETLERFLRGPGLLRHPPRGSERPVPPEAPQSGYGHPVPPPVPPPPPGHGHPVPPPEREWPLDEAERAAGATVLAEARAEAERAGFSVETDIRKGRPEQIIVQAAGDRNCRLIVVRAEEGSQGRPQIGPESVGHSARFVLDHATCDVLLLREV